MTIFNVLILMSTAGAVGGFLFGMRKRGLVFPHAKSGPHAYELGCVGDCIFGAAGAIIIFLIVPLELKADASATDVAYIVKILGLSLLGGYGGPAVIDKALSRTLTDLEQRTQVVENTLDRHQKQTSLDGKAIEYADIQLSDTLHPITPIEDLTNAIKKASPMALEGIFQMTKDVRHSAWRNEKKGLIERTIPIFKALVGSEQGANRHRYHAQLGYALKDQLDPNWANAKDAMERAITLLKSAGKPVSPFYAFNWAKCCIELENRDGSRSASLKGRDNIVEALRIGSSFEILKKAISKDESIMDWLARNNISIRTIGVLEQAA